MGVATYSLQDMCDPDARSTNHSWWAGRLCVDGLAGPAGGSIANALGSTSTNFLGTAMSAGDSGLGAGVLRLETQSRKAERSSLVVLYLVSSRGY